MHHYYTVCMFTKEKRKERKKRKKNKQRKYNLFLLHVLEYIQIFCARKGELSVDIRQILIGNTSYFEIRLSVE